MALSLSSNYFPFFPPNPHPKNPQFPISTLNPIPQPSRPPLLLTCRATSRSRSQSSPANKNNATKTNKKRKKRTEPDSSFKDVEIVREDGENFYNDLSDDDFEEPSFPSSSSNYVSGSRGSRSLATTTTAMPKPPAGFVVDETGRIVLVSDKRVATIVDSTNNCPLECIIRRVFRSSQGDECMLLCPLDTPVQILKSTNVDGWSAVNDDEVEAILPAAAYALAKIHMHLVHSGFCYTARGGFCYSEDDIFDFRTDDGQSIDGLPSEGVEITCFHLDGAHYMIYTPSDPLLFVAVKDQNGLLQIANDDLLDDPAIIDAIDEETEFNALVEEEAALLESLMGKR